MNMLKRIHFLAIALAFGCPAYALPPYAYIQRGLVAQWDGIDNAGTGTHVADTNAWTDLAGNCEPLSSAALSFVDGDCAWLQGKALATICPALPTVYSASTIEAHGYASKFTSHPGTDDLIGCGQGCSIFWQAGSTKFGISYVHDTTLKLYYQGTNQKVTPPADIYTCNTLTLAQHDYTRELYISGTPASFASNANQWPGSPCATITQNIKFGSGNDGTYWKAHSLRVYARALSATEVAYNAAVDNVRFHGASLSNALPATLPDGYRLNEQGNDIEVQVTCTTDPSDGTVSINGGEASASAECWVALGGAVAIAFQPAAGKTVGIWSGAPSHATYPTPEQMTFAAHGPETVSVSAKVVSEIPVVALNAVRNIGTASATLDYNVTSAGALTNSVTLYACHGQRPDRLLYTNSVEEVFGEGSMLITGLIQERAYHVKLVADGAGRKGESEVLSFAALPGNYEPSYDARQPLVTSCNITGLPTAFRLRGYVTAPAGTGMTLYYGTGEDFSAMTGVAVPTSAFSDGIYRIDMQDLAPLETYHFVLKTESGLFVDYYPMRSVTTLAAWEGDMGKHGYVHFSDSYLQAQHLIENVETGPFSISVWVRNPRGRSTKLPAGSAYSWDYAGVIIGNGAYGQSPGMSIAAVPSGFTDADSFLANPSYSLWAFVRDSAANQIGVEIPASYGIWQDDTWHHVVATYVPSEKTLRLYLDGTFFGSNSLPSMGNLNASVFNFTLGAIYYNVAQRRLIGDVAQVSVWRKALAKSDIRMLRRAPLEGTEDGLAAYWPLDGGATYADFCEGADPANLTGSASAYAVRGPVFGLPGTLIFLK